MKLSSIDLNLLVALEALLVEASVTKAAARLHLTQSATSHTLTRLREVLNDPVLVRQGRGMVLTPRAIEIKKRLPELLVDIDRLISDTPNFDPYQVERSFHVATGNIATIAVTIIDGFLAAAARFPKIDIQLALLDQDYPVRLANGELDLALVSVSDPAPKLPSTIVTSEPMTCIARKEDAPALQNLSLEDFAGIPHLRVANGTRELDGLTAKLASLGLERNVAFSVADFLHAPLHIVSGPLIAVVPCRYATFVKRWIPIETFTPPIELDNFLVHMVWHERADQDPASRWARELTASILNRTPFPDPQANSD